MTINPVFFLWRARPYIVLRYFLARASPMVSPNHSVCPEETPHKDVSIAGYRQLAEIRYRIRQFLRFSEEAARSFGIEPQQHQLLLVIKGLPAGTRPTVRNLSNRLCLRHNSTVELINRLAERGAVMRRQSEQDRRE